MISFPYDTIPSLLARLREAEARACGLDDKANELRAKVQRLYNIMPYGAQIILTEEDLKGVLM